MSKKSWRNPNKEIPVMPQRFNWKSHKIFSDYAKAASEKATLLGSGKEHVKIRRCGPMGTQFRVKVGHPVKTKKEVIADEK